MSKQPTSPTTRCCARVHREQVVALSGPRALLMQAAHPVAFEGFFAAHRGARRSLRAPAPHGPTVMDAIAFGLRRGRARATAARARHARRVPRRARRARRALPGRHAVRGRRPGAAAVDRRRAGRLGRPGLRALRDGPEPAPSARRYWRDYRVVGRLFGLRDATCPRVDDFEAYMSRHARGGDLLVTPTAREVGVEIVLRPPVPLKVRPLVELANFITVGLLPGAIRRRLRLLVGPARAVALRGGAEYVKRVLVPCCRAGWRSAGGCVRAPSGGLSGRRGRRPWVVRPRRPRRQRERPAPTA